MITDPAETKRLDTIWKRQKEETDYWIAEWLDGCQSKNISVHRMEDSGIEHTIVFDLDDGSAVLIQTDTTVKDPDDSHKYTMLESKVLEKLSTLLAVSRELKP